MFGGLTLLSCLALGTGLTQIEQKSPGLKEVIEADWYTVVAAPDKTLVHRVNGVSPTIAIGKAITPSKAWVKDFVQALTDPTSIKPNVRPKCGFNPDVRVSLGRSEKHLDIDFCFGCSMLRMTNREGNPETASVYFGPGRAKFLPLMLKLFPDDKRLQSQLHRRGR